MSYIDNGCSGEVKTWQCFISKMDRCYNPEECEANQIWSYDDLVYDYDGNLISHTKETQAIKNNSARSWKKQNVAHIVAKKFGIS